MTSHGQVQPVILNMIGRYCIYRLLAIHTLNAICRHFNAPSTVQEVEALQAKLIETEDEDEQRALEEDVTGKILWLCWCGIRAEVDELLSKVVHYIRMVQYPWVSGVTRSNVATSPPSSGTRESN
ncbi:hypothetical protein M404DRAFT_1001125 [Pisolithus tinctorius Marx 270]|uniref:DNAJ-containing protein X-domain domain-containing protein n=1 Tax=Pisolithus tinctorius Marx 270 TaxID=870435 RepID=A0A0C3P837_PISTI|nr:hypothetical protein M404DRAFT_1001125 [Pisolithus tinctorius Marx 270]